MILYFHKRKRVGSPNRLKNRWLNFDETVDTMAFEPDLSQSLRQFVIIFYRRTIDIDARKEKKQTRLTLYFIFASPSPSRPSWVVSRLLSGVSAKGREELLLKMSLCVPVWAQMRRREHESPVLHWIRENTR